MTALLDRDGAALREGDPLPRAWNAMLFNAPTRQSQLRADDAAGLGVPLPEIGLPRLMMGGGARRAWPTSASKTVHTWSIWN